MQRQEISFSRTHRCPSCRTETTGASGHVRQHVDILDSRRGSLLAASSGDMLFTQPRRGVWTAVHCVTHGAFEGDTEGDRPRLLDGLWVGTVLAVAAGSDQGQGGPRRGPQDHRVWHLRTPWHGVHRGRRGLLNGHDSGRDAEQRGPSIRAPFRERVQQPERSRQPHQRPLNRLEGVLGYATTRLVRIRGMHPHTFPFHLKECEFRSNHRGQDLYHALRQLCREYPFSES